MRSIDLGDLRNLDRPAPQVQAVKRLFQEYGDNVRRFCDEATADEIFASPEFRQMLKGIRQGITGIVGLAVKGYLETEGRGLAEQRMEEEIRALMEAQDGQGACQRIMRQSESAYPLTTEQTDILLEVIIVNALGVSINTLKDLIQQQREGGYTLTQRQTNLVIDLMNIRFNPHFMAGPYAVYQLITGQQRYGYTLSEDQISNLWWMCSVDHLSSLITGQWSHSYVLSPRHITGMLDQLGVPKNSHGAQRLCELIAGQEKEGYALEKPHVDRLIDLLCGAEKAKPDAAIKGLLEEAPAGLLDEGQTKRLSVFIARLHLLDAYQLAEDYLIDKTDYSAAGTQLLNDAKALAARAEDPDRLLAGYLAARKAVGGHMADAQKTAAKVREAFAAAQAEFAAVKERETLTHPAQLAQLKSTMEDLGFGAWNNDFDAVQMLDDALAGRETWYVKEAESDRAEATVEALSPERLARMKQHVADWHRSYTDRGETVPAMTFVYSLCGAMKPNKAAPALALEVVMQELEALGVPVEILGGTTSGWKGNEVREDWLTNGRSPEPGRLNDVLLLPIKPFAMSSQQALAGMTALYLQGLPKENIDGEYLAWAVNRSQEQGDGPKHITHLCTRASADDSTISTNPSDYLNQQELAVVEAIKAGDDKVKLNSVCVEGDGRQHSLQTHYHAHNALLLSTESPLGPRVETTVKMLLPPLPSAEEIAAQQTRQDEIMAIARELGVRGAGEAV